MKKTRYIYLKDDEAQGFIKPYEGDFSFAALLPNEGVTPEGYLSKLTGKKVLDLLKNKEDAYIMAKLPKFKTEFEAPLADPLKSLGIKDAFDAGKANFSKMATSANGNIFISDVFHKTFIEVNEAGTKAAAVTKVDLNAMGGYDTIKELTFDRPFLYMIIDNETNLPLFIGIMNNPAK